MPFLAVLALLVQERPLAISDDLELRGRVQVWRPWIGGTLKGDEDNSPLGFDDDLDLEHPGWVPTFEVGLFAPEKRDPSGRGVSISVWSFATSSETRLEGDEEFEGSSFPAGSTLRSRFRLLTFGIDATVAGRRVSAEPFAWRFGVGLHYLEAEVRLSSPTARESEEYGDGNLKFALDGEYRPLPWAFLSGRIAAYTDFFSLLLGIDSGHYGLDAEISAGLQTAPLRLEIGLRAFSWTLNWTESQIDVFAHGPFVALTLAF